MIEAVIHHHRMVPNILVVQCPEPRYDGKKSKKIEWNRLKLNPTLSGIIKDGPSTQD